ncbi:hypothetical protein [Streptomyces griseus]|nr:hypothetical protein [Streptomyces griseus]
MAVNLRGPRTPRAFHVCLDAPTADTAQPATTPGGDTLHRMLGFRA